MIKIGLLREESRKKGGEAHTGRRKQSRRRERGGNTVDEVQEHRSLDCDIEVPRRRKK